MGVVHMSNSDERRPFTPSDEELMKVSRNRTIIIIIIIIIR